MTRKDFLSTLAFAPLVAAGAKADPKEIMTAEPIRIVGPEIARLDFTRTDGGLPLAPGIQTSTVFRADKEHPEKSDGRGWTYHHHPDIACWKGRLYVGWDSCEMDEDTWPSRELYSTSTDGQNWTPPQELFPQGASTPLRVYFFHAPNGRMLAIAGLRVSQERTPESTKGGLVVREINADHTLGPVYTLRRPPEVPPTGALPQSPLFINAKDAGFVTACQQLLGNHLYLEQQDNGKLLNPADRIKWHDYSLWTGSETERPAEGEFGKAMCFFRRADGALVAVMKKRWVTVSHDDGKTWSQPVRPPSLITNMGKVWGQKTPGGRYILTYNPHASLRYPLVLVTSRDGITFQDMHALHGPLPEVRYTGRAKSRGASYGRGISQWASDGSRKDNAAWLVYSINKEEICVTCIPS
jgi:hypothetical protein